MPEYYKSPPPIVQNVYQALGERDSAPVSQEVVRVRQRLSQSLGIPWPEAPGAGVFGAADRIVNLTSQLVHTRNEEQTRYYPRGETLGEYRAQDNQLLYHVEAKTRVVDVACKLLRVPEVSGLLECVSELGGLETANSGNSEAHRAISKVTELIRAGRPEEASHVRFSTTQDIVALEGDSAEIRFRYNQVAGDLAKDILAHAKHYLYLTRGQAKLDLVERWLEIELAANSENLVWYHFKACAEMRWLPYIATTVGIESPVTRPDQITKELAPFEELERKSSDLLRVVGERVPGAAQDHSDLKKRLEVVKSLHLRARFHAALASARRGVAQGDLTQALKGYASSVLYASTLSALPQERSDTWDDSRSNITEEARKKVVTHVGQRASFLAPEEVDRWTALLSEFMAPSEATLALADGMAQAREKVLVRPRSSDTRQLVDSLLRWEGELCKECLRTLSIAAPHFEVSSEVARKWAAPQREIAISCLERLLRDAFDNKDGPTIASLQTALGACIDSERDPDNRRHYQIRAVGLIGTYALATPDSPLLRSALLRSIVALPHDASMERAQELTKSFLETALRKACERRDEAIVARKATSSVTEQRAVARNIELAEAESYVCIGTLSSAVSHDLIGDLSARDKVERFARFRAALQGRMQSEERELARFLKEHGGSRITETLRTFFSSDGEAAPKVKQFGLSSAAEEEVKRTRRSRAMGNLSLARIALLANEATLTREAKKIIESIDADGLEDENSLKLLNEFRRTHESTPLVALIKQMLFESVRDLPLETGLLMLGGGASLGILSHLLVRRGGVGFALGSYATLALTKLECVMHGVENGIASYETGLTFSEGLMPLTDASALVSDMIQIGLLYRTHLVLRRSGGLSSSAVVSDTSTITMITSELLACGKLFLQQFDLRNPILYLASLQLGVGVAQISSQAATSKEFDEQLLTFSLGILPILAISIAHDRVQEKLEGGK